MQRWFSLKNILVTLAVLVVVWLGLKMWFRAPKNRLQNLATTRVTRENIGRTLQLSGTVKPLHTVKIISQVSARVKNIHIKDGELVIKDRLLLEFDVDELTSKLASARANHFKALSGLREVENSRSSPRYVDIKANLEISQAELATREKAYVQNQQLYQAKAISRQDLERSKLDLDRARADLGKYQAQLLEFEKKYGPQAMQEAQAQLSLDGSKGQSSGETSLSPKSSVSPGQVLFSLESHDQLAVEVFVNEEDILKVHPGQPCAIRLPALPGDKFGGQVESITPTEIGDRFTAFKVRCRILPLAGKENTPNKEQDLESQPPRISSDKMPPVTGSGSQMIVGMRSNVTIPLEERTNVLIIPITSLVKKNGTPGVFAMNKVKPVFTPVKVGVVSQNAAEIIEGLDEGQEILEEVPGKLLEQSSFSGG